MKELAATVTSKGQVTVPAEIRRYLGLRCGDKLSFVVTDDGEIVLRAPKYRTVASLAGAAGRLPQPLTIADMLEVARDDALARDHWQDPERR